jgi:hypothetical protein
MDIGSLLAAIDRILISAMPVATLVAARRAEGGRPRSTQLVQPTEVLCGKRPSPELREALLDDAYVDSLLATLPGVDPKAEPIMVGAAHGLLGFVRSFCAGLRWGRLVGVSCAASRVNANGWESKVSSAVRFAFPSNFFPCVRACVRVEQAGLVAWFVRGETSFVALRMPVGRVRAGWCKALDARQGAMRCRGGARQGGTTCKGRVQGRAARASLPSRGARRVALTRPPPFVCACAARCEMRILLFVIK